MWINLGKRRLILWLLWKIRRLKYTKDGELKKIPYNKLWGVLKGIFFWGSVFLLLCFISFIRFSKIIG